MAVNHFTASGIVTSYHVPIAFPALVYGGPSSTPNTPTGPHGSAKPCGLVFLYARGHGGLLVFSFMHCLESSSVWRTWIEIYARLCCMRHGRAGASMAAPHCILGRSG